MLEAADFQAAAGMVPGQESVKLIPTGPNGIPIPIDGARKRPVSRKELQAANIRLRADACSWILPASELGGYQPTPEDKVQQEDGTNWLIKDVGDGLMGTEFKCVCTKGRVG